MQLLHIALGDDPSFYERLVKRGFLESAIEYTRYALTVVDRDTRPGHDGIECMVVLEALLSARSMGTPNGAAQASLADQLRIAGTAASTAARELRSNVVVA